MPVYYSKKEEADPVFHVFLGCAEGSKIAIEDRVEKVKKRTVCRECLILMKQATWVLPPTRTAPAPPPTRRSTSTTIGVES